MSIVCGISGIASFGTSPERMLNLVRDMGRYLSHRGPDAWGEWSDIGVVLGHNRLAILDLEGGAQPMQSSDGRHTIVFNGEIYNFKELRVSIKAEGGSLRTDHSDTEAIVEGYRLWGEGVFARLDGMFACAIWTSANRRLVLARDRLGIKPLYYFALPSGGLAFASEPKALVGSGLVAPRMDEGGLAEYFLFRAPLHPGTLFSGIFKVPPGTVLQHQADDGVSRVWQFSDPTQSLASPTSALRRDDIRDILREGVRTHLVADVEVGVFLSGGVDSSLVAALAAQFQKVNAFTISSPGPLDEAPFAKKVADQLGASLDTRVVTAAEMLGCLDDWAYFNDDPVADPSALALMLLSRSVKARGLKVMLSGEGGDELFGGYPAYARFLAARTVTRYVGQVPAWANPARDFRTREYLADGECPYWGTAHVTSGAMRHELLGIESAPLKARVLSESSSSDVLRHAMAVDKRLRLSNDILMRTDRATMASSVEARVPLLANEVLLAASTLPNRDLCKIFPLRNKPLLKEIASSLVGPEVIYRRKIGFDLPIAIWLSRDLEHQIRRMIREAILPRVSYAALSRWYEALQRGQRRLAPALWAWFTLERWYRKWIVDSPRSLSVTSIATNARP